MERWLAGGKQGGVVTPTLTDDDWDTLRITLSNVMQRIVLRKREPAPPPAAPTIGEYGVVYVNRWYSQISRLRNQVEAKDAEIRLLKQELIDRNGSVHGGCQAEISRLRMALEEIRGIEQGAVSAQSIARDALAGGKGES